MVVERNQDTMNRTPEGESHDTHGKHRPWELHETVFHQLLDKCRLWAPVEAKVRFRNKLLSLDAPVIPSSAGRRVV
jgi:hypothetical protein